MTHRSTTPPEAPGELRTVQAFVNTADRKTRTDLLREPEQLVEWLVEWNLMLPDTEISWRDFKRALAARAGIRALVEAHSGYPLDEGAIERLNLTIHGACPQIHFHRDGRPSFQSENFDDALGHLISLVVMTRLAGQWAHFRACANEDCRALFYSNKSTTKWCTRRCGDLIRARTHRRGKRLANR